MRYLLYRAPTSESTVVEVPCVGALLDPKGAELRSGLYLVRPILGEGKLGRIKMVYRSRLRYMPRDHEARDLDLPDLDSGIQGDPRERAWRKL